MASDIVFRISGAPLDDAVLPKQFKTDIFPSRAVFKVFSHRSSDKLARVVAKPGRSVIAVKIMGGPLLVLHPERARDLFKSAHIPARGDPDDVAITSTLPWTVARHGKQYGAKLTAADALIDWVAILGSPEDGPLRDVGVDTPAAAFDRLRPAMLYRLAAQGIPGNAEREAARVADTDAGHGKPLLILLHGAFAQTAETFGAMWRDEDSRQTLAGLFRHYGEDNVLAFDHPSLCQTPVGNALALAERLPMRATLDFLTHGDGGLIAEVLLRAGRTDDPASPADYFDPPTQDQLARLRQLLRSRAISIRRIVRVACPARGSLLASQRLDAYLSVSLWLARISRMSLEEAWFGLLCDVARCAAPITALKGLGDMLPTAGLIRWLNAPLAKVDSELYIIAGDSEGDSLLAWLQSLVSDALFWTDNDLVVQTRSMYGGVPRMPGRSGPMILLLRDDKITHFSYFQRKKAVQAICAALQGELADGYQAPAGAPAAPSRDLAAIWTSIGPRSWRSGDGRESRAGGAPAGPADASKPWLVLIPDVFGSLLTDQRGTRLWLDEQSIAGYARLDVSRPGAETVKPERLSRLFYGELRTHLERTHHVLEFPYDWRLDLNDSAAKLARFVDAQVRSPRMGEQPLRILAQGMGGLLVRAWHAGHADSWRRMIGRTGARIVMLGVPNAGSFLPLRLFSGDETFGSLFSTSLPISEALALRKVLARMPGVVQLQAGLVGDKAELDKDGAWRALEGEEFRALRENDLWHGVVRDGVREHLDQWAVPEPALLLNAAAFWERLDRALPDLLRYLDNLVLVAGTGYPTVTGIEKHRQDLFFITSRDGDRQVTLDSAALPEMPLWLIGASHDALSRTRAAFSALTDLLVRGETSRLSRTGRRLRHHVAPAPQTLTRRLPSHGGRVFATHDLPDLLRVAASAEDGADDELSIKVYHGDLRFVRDPLLVGHYRSMTLTGTEAAIDGLIAARMSKALRTGVYPERVGSFHIFENGRHRSIGRRKQRYIPRPRAAIVVGLAEEGKLTAQQLSYTLRIGVLAYAEHFTDASEQQERFELAAVLVGSGGTGVSVSMAAVALLQGVLDANVKLRQAGWPVVATLTIVELYLDRATDALRVLNMQARSMPSLKVEKFLLQGDGGLRRPLDTSYRGAAYDFISALKSPESTAAMPVIAYALDTRRARTEVRAQRSQGPLVRDLVCKSSNTITWDRQIGRTLFNLLIPVEIEPYLTGSSDMLMELDATTATLPWEMLDTDPPLAPAQDASARPWAVRCKVLRKLRTEEYRSQVIDAATEDKILVIGDPLTPGPDYPQLEGARREANGIATVARTALGAHREQVVELSDRPNATTIINALFASRYRIVHIAGHGTGPDGCEGGGGIILSGRGICLGAGEVKAMRVTPELVFLNCCHLAKMPMPQNYDRVLFAANIARQLIDIGVRCVIAAGWAIEDEPAQVFAITFYREIFSGARFIDAVGTARLEAYKHKRESNTWAAYQCYGDPDWSWKTATGSIQPTPAEEYEGVASPTTLILVLQALKTELLYATCDATARNRDRLAYLQERFALWTDSGAVAQEFAAAFAALPDREAALDWYRKATRAKDGTGSITAVELQAEQLSLPEATVPELETAIAMFGQICERYGKSLRRLTMSGNAHRRLSVKLLVSPRAADAPGSLPGSGEHLELARNDFLAAAACEPEAVSRFYPLRVAIACKVRQKLLLFDPQDPQVALADWLDREADSLDRELAEVSLEIQRGLRDNPNFWPIVAQSELEMLKGVIKMNLAPRQGDISASLRDRHNRISTRRFWAYVYDDAMALLEVYKELVGPEDKHAESKAAGTLLKELDEYCRRDSDTAAAG